MGKRVVLAVAGSGKTTHIVESLDLGRRSLILTYTNNNVENIRQKIIEKFGYFPANIRLQPYFTFLYSFCYRPLYSVDFPSKGVTFATPPRFVRKTSTAFYRDGGNRLYSNRIAGLLHEAGVMPSVAGRLNKYFDDLIIDELQDLGGRDFNFLIELSASVPSMLLVGDFYQHTFNTSWDGNINKSLYDDEENFRAILLQAGFEIDAETLTKSYRCSPTICEYISSELKIDIQSRRSDKVKIIVVDDSALAAQIFGDKSVIKLFYQKHYLYKCNSRNWGDCKGEDRYQDVCIVLNDSTKKLFEKNKLGSLAPLTRNKLYVALTRARGDVYIIDEQLLKSF